MAYLTGGDSMLDTLLYALSQFIKGNELLGGTIFLVVNSQRAKLCNLRGRLFMIGFATGRPALFITFP